MALFVLCWDCNGIHDLAQFPDGTCHGAHGACDGCGRTKELEWDEVAGGKFCVSCYDKLPHNRRLAHE